MYAFLQVKKYMALAAQDIRFDVPLAEACYEDRQKYCGSVPPVGRGLGWGGYAMNCAVKPCVGRMPPVSALVLVGMGDLGVLGI